MTRNEAIEQIRQCAARALGVPIERIRAGWDQAHGKPKVEVLATLDTVLMSSEQSNAALDAMLDEPSIQIALAALREAPSDDQLRARLKALRDRQNAS